MLNVSTTSTTTTLLVRTTIYHFSKQHHHLVVVVLIQLVSLFSFFFFRHDNCKHVSSSTAGARKRKQSSTTSSSASTGVSSSSSLSSSAKRSKSSSTESPPPTQKSSPTTCSDHSYITYSVRLPIDNSSINSLSAQERVNKLYDRKSREEKAKTEEKRIVIMELPSGAKVDRWTVEDSKLTVILKKHPLMFSAEAIQFAGEETGCIVDLPDSKRGILRDNACFEAIEKFKHSINAKSSVFSLEKQIEIELEVEVIPESVIEYTYCYDASEQNDYMQCIFAYFEFKVGSKMHSDNFVKSTSVSFYGNNKDASNNAPGSNHTSTSNASSSSSSRSTRSSNINNTSSNANTSSTSNSSHGRRKANSLGNDDDGDVDMGLDESELRERIAVEVHEELRKELDKHMELEKQRSEQEKSEFVNQTKSQFKAYKAKTREVYKEKFDTFKQEHVQKYDLMASKYKDSLKVARIEIASCKDDNSKLAEQNEVLKRMVRQVQNELELVKRKQQEQKERNNNTSQERVKFQSALTDDSPLKRQRNNDGHSFAVPHGLSTSGMHTAKNDKQDNSSAKNHTAAAVTTTKISPILEDEAPSSRSMYESAAVLTSHDVFNLEEKLASLAADHEEEDEEQKKVSPASSSSL